MKFLNVKPGFKCLMRFALRCGYVYVYLNAPRNEWAPGRVCARARLSAPRAPW